MSEAIQPFDSRPATYEHITEVRANLLLVIEDFLRRAHVHDDSKLRDPELATFDEYTPKLKDAVYGSDEYKAFLVGMKPALDHHYAANSHHPEHYKDGFLGMNLLDVVEMLCDWLAAVMRNKDGDIRKSIDINQERFGYDDQVKRLLLNTLSVIE